MAARILIVEDERDLAEVIKARLTSVGHRCAVLTDPLHAFEFVRAKRPDLVISDVMMPKISGFELCRKIRMDPIVFGIPILMLSAMSEAPEIQHAYEQGANDYIVKPFDPGDLLQRVKDLLAQKRQIDAVNALTGMPGRDHLQQVIMNKLFREEKIAVLHFSLSNSTAFANAYNHERRDAAIASVAEMIPDTARAIQALEVYTAHLGHFDFLICCNAPDGGKLADALARRFDRLKATLYDKGDFERGNVVVKGETHPLMQAVISVITNEELRMNAPRMVRIAMELNRRAQRNGSATVVTAADALIV